MEKATSSETCHPIRSYKLLRMCWALPAHYKQQEHVMAENLPGLLMLLVCLEYY